MKYLLWIITLLILYSCSPLDGIKISLKKASMTVAELSGRVEKNFGLNGSVSLENMKTTERYVANVSARQRVCLSDNS